MDSEISLVETIPDHVAAGELNVSKIYSDTALKMFDSSHPFKVDELYLNISVEKIKIKNKHKVKCFLQHPMSHVIMFPFT